MIAAAILRRGLLHPDRPAVIDDLGVLTYGELRRRTLGAAAGLMDLGLGRGDRVGLVLGNRRHHVEALLAAAFLGIIAVPVDPEATPEEIRRAVERFRLGALLLERPELGESRELRRLAETQGRIVTLGQAPGAVLFPDADPSALAGGEPPVDPDGIFSLSLTSGSTGEPKAIVLTNRIMMERFMAQVVEFGLHAEDRFLLTTPIHYGAGRSYALNHLFVGAAVEMRDRLLADAILPEIARRRISTAFLVPTQVVRCLQHAGERSWDLSSLRCLIVSGSALDPAARAGILTRVTRNLYEVYASTEVGAISIVSPMEREAEGDAIGMGHPLWNLDLRLARRRRDGVGEIVCRGPAVAAGHLDEPRPRSPWRRTGDLACRDAEGRLHWAGRAGDVIVTGGRNVQPSEVEAVLSDHPAVREAAVVGLPDPVWGDAVTAFLVAAEGTSAQELVRHCRQRLAPYKVPKSFHLVSSLPTTSSGKVDRKRLRGWGPGRDAL